MIDKEIQLSRELCFLGRIHFTTSYKYSVQQRFYCKKMHLDLHSFFRKNGLIHLKHYNAKNLVVDFNMWKFEKWLENKIEEISTKEKEYLLVEFNKLKTNKSSLKLKNEFQAEVGMSFFPYDIDSFLNLNIKTKQMVALGNHIGKLINVS